VELPRSCWQVVVCCVVAVANLLRCPVVPTRVTSCALDRTRELYQDARDALA
jgi:hypothetical protein